MGELGELPWGCIVTHHNPSPLPVSQLLRDLRAACRSEAPSDRVSLELGPWLPPGTATGSWGPLVPPCGHPGEADALISLAGSPVALLRRRWHRTSPDDPDAGSLPSGVPLYELISPYGRDRLSSMHLEALVIELAARLGVAPPWRP